MTNIVPMPAFTDPHNPAAATGSINYGVKDGFPPFEAHPLEHSVDYGAAVGGVVTQAEVDERESWGKDQWVELAKAYDLPHSGTKQDIIDRVETFEAEHEGSGE